MLDPRYFSLKQIEHIVIYAILLYYPILRYSMIKDSQPLMRRRLKSALAVLSAQMLLIALAIAWLIQMILIAVNGAVYFVEGNSVILWIEIAVSLLITIFAIYVLIRQIQRLGERRREDRDADGRPGGGLR